MSIELGRPFSLITSRLLNPTAKGFEAYTEASLLNKLRGAERFYGINYAIGLAAISASFAVMAANGHNNPDYPPFIIGLVNLCASSALTHTLDIRGRNLVTQIQQRIEDLK